MGDKANQNRDLFREVYAKKLHEAIDRNPEEYFYGHDQVDKVVDKMILSLSTGNAHFHGASKSAAKKFGITTVKGIKDFLNGVEK